MTCRDIYNFLDSKFPFETQAHWDNSGFLVGDINSNVKKALITLDISNQSVDKAIEKNCDLIISHHPVIFHPLENVLDNTAVYSLIKNGINAICLHTPLDIGKGGINDALIAALELENLDELTCEGEAKMCRVGEIKPISPVDFAKTISENLNTNVRFNHHGKTVKKVAVCGGAGSEFYKEAIKQGCDAFVTGEVKHHEFVACDDCNFTIFEAGHYETEMPGVIELSKLLKKELGLCCEVYYYA